MSDCITTEACSDEPTQFIYTGQIIFDGTAFTCDFDPTFEAAVGDKMNDLLAMLFTHICALKNAVGTDVDDFITNVALNGTSLDFTAVGAAFSGSIDLSSLVGSNDIDYVSNVSFAGTTLTFAATGNGFAGPVDLVDIDGRFTGITFDGSTLTFTGINSQATLNIDISSVNTDTNDIDYINSAVLVGNTLNLTGLGNAGASVDLTPLVNTAVSEAVASIGGGNDDDKIGRWVNVTETDIVAGATTVWTNGSSGSKILSLSMSWTQTVADPAATLSLNVYGAVYVITKATYDADGGNVLVLINAPVNEEGQRYLNGGNALTITAEVADASGDSTIIFNAYGYDY